LIAGLMACGGRAPTTPRDTFIAYVKASKKKDYTAMKQRLSAATMKMHQQEAKAQGTTVDDIIKQEPVLGEGQRTVEYRNEKIEEDKDKATLQYKTSYGSWETLAFVREDGVWKIDKQAVVDKMMQDMDESNRKLDEAIRGMTPLY
jgi:hypothetical protein